MAFLKENKEIIQALDDIDLTKENQQYKTPETLVHYIKPCEKRYSKELKYIIKTAPPKKKDLSKPDDKAKTDSIEEGDIFFHMMFIDVPKNRPQKIKNLSERPYYKAFKDPVNHWYSQPKGPLSPMLCGP